MAPTGPRTAVFQPSFVQESLLVNVIVLPDAGYERVEGAISREEFLAAITAFNSVFGEEPYKAAMRAVQKKGMLVGVYNGLTCDLYRRCCLGGF